MSWQVEESLSEEAWQENHLYDVLSAARSRPRMPKIYERFGRVEVTWEELDPGVAAIHSLGGTPDDRRLAEMITAAKLEAHGYERAEFSFDRHETRTADWSDIEAKAKRLIQSGNVHILRNGYNNVIGYVKGDHGEYQSEIGRDDPDSRAITTWQCECPWDQFAWGRTRQWKKYEGRPCAHVLATFWKAQSTPLDEDAEGMAPTPGQRGPIGPPMPPAMPGQPPQGPVGPGPMQAPAMPGPGVLPMSPTEQLQQLQPAVPGSTPPGLPAPPNSVSVPGARQPGPANPVQIPSTYSSWHFSQTDFQNGDMVRLEEAEYGVAEGKSEAHGAGQPREIPVNSIGEVLGQDQLTGWVDVIFAGPQERAGPLEPYHIRAWIEPQKLTPMPGVKKPGPAVRRR